MPYHVSIEVDFFQFASRAKAIKNKPTVNEVSDFVTFVMINQITLN